MSFLSDDNMTTAAPASYQQRVYDWMVEAFGTATATDRLERCHRFFEEAAELVQSLGCAKADAIALVDYVYGRPVGDVAQEFGGAMVTLAGLAAGVGVQLVPEAERELARVWEKIDKIRAKHAAKPRGSALPGQVAAMTELPRGPVRILEATAPVPTDAQIDTAAEALLNVRGMRRGAPSVSNLRAIVPAKIWEEAKEDARAALAAAHGG